MKALTLTAAAHRHVRKLLKSIRPHSKPLARQFRARLRGNFDAQTIRALLAITPASAAEFRSLSGFIEQVDYYGRRLAKLNVSPEQVSAWLDDFDGLLAGHLSQRFGPAREQLRLATQFAVKDAYYKVREAEVQAFFGLSRAEAEAENLDDLLRRCVRVLTSTFRAVAGRLFPECARRNRKLSSARYIERGRQGEDWIADDAMRGRYASYWSFPLGNSGLIQFAFSTPYPWLPRELMLLQAAASRCSDAIERVRLRDEVRRLGAETQQAESDERRRIGRDLHDETGQSLLLMRLKLEMLERDAPPDIRPALAEVREIAEQTVVELRRVIKALGPALLERLGLREGLQQLAARFRKMCDARLVTRIAAIPDSIPRQTEEVIYRVAQECLQNVVKHSHASCVNLFLQTTDKRVRLGVRDNGDGCSPKLASRKAWTFGLAGMRERTSLLGGTLAVSSRPGKGFSVTLDLPRNPAPERNG